MAGFLGEVAGRTEGVGVPFTLCRAMEAGVSNRAVGLFSGLEGWRGAWASGQE